MKPEIALKLLAEVMRWTNERATEEFGWFALMARLKYDDYRDFLAGMRFLESFVAWLQQFEQSEREAAYDFARRRLIYISAAERERLIALLYPREIWPRLAKAAAGRAKVPRWRVLVDLDAQKELARERRSTLYLGLSDGARLDAFRHLNEGTISNEQVVVGVELDETKWADLLKKLRRELKDPAAKFTRIVLVDDFTASGTSLLRREEDGWTGKLPRFLRSIHDQNVTAKECVLLIHHLLGTPKAKEHLLAQRDAYFKEKLPESTWMVEPFELSFGHLFSANVPLSPDQPGDKAFCALTQKYYSDQIETEHTIKGGVKHLGLGFAGCALPVVLDHNTPNNSVALLWAQTDGKNGQPAIRPLFRRRQRHL
jgi:hypothetical protein